MITFFYSLISSKNSRLVGLSGSPVASLPSAVGVLYNTLHGSVIRFSIRLNTGSSPPLHILLQQIKEKKKIIYSIKSFVPIDQ